MSQADYEYPLDVVGACHIATDRKSFFAFYKKVQHFAERTVEKPCLQPHVGRFDKQPEVGYSESCRQTDSKGVL